MDYVLTQVVVFGQLKFQGVDILTLCRFSGSAAGWLFCDKRIELGAKVPCVTAVRVSEAKKPGGHMIFIVRVFA